MKKKIILLILDGVGLSKKKKHNALFLAKTPHLDRLGQECLNSHLNASGEAVGLPKGVMGNSEVGHLTIGSGRILPQDLPRISKFTQENSFAEMPDIQRVGQMKGNIHLLGLVSKGFVHSSFDHLISLITDLNKAFCHKKISIHIITDGRDTLPYSGKDCILELENIISHLDNVKISSVMGRFYGMDRDKRWERTEKAYKALTFTGGHETFSSASKGIQASYDSGLSDEFIVPFYIKEGLGIQSQDQCIAFNFRADRMRQIVEALSSSDFSAFEPSIQLPSHNLLTFTQYNKNFNFPVLFPKEVPSNCLGEVFSQYNLKQLRIAETDRILIPSPKDIATYDQKPEMSAYEVTDQLISNIQKYPIIIGNFANGDMVGHTGNEKAAIKAVEVMDECLGRIVCAAKKSNHEIFITSDHGNCEEMICSKSSQIFTQHTTNPVPFIWVSPFDQISYKLSDGQLSDIAPTLLSLLDLPIPKEMTGRNLIETLT